MPSDSPMPSPDINAPSPTSSVSIEDLNVQNLNYDQSFNSLSSTNEYMINSSMESSNNDVDAYIPTTIINIVKPYTIPEPYSVVPGMITFLIWF